ncbi:MAG: hypothetical protein H7242_06765, partial [Microbacteriaceae bacterium]|nr:hypothetical protein [Burkholderiaceae bacterium]
MNMELPLPALAVHLDALSAPVRAYLDVATSAARERLAPGGVFDAQLAHVRQRE